MMDLSALSQAMSAVAEEATTLAQHVTALAKTGEALTTIADTFTSLQDALMIQRACMPAEKVFTRENLASLQAAAAERTSMRTGTRPAAVSTEPRAPG